MSDVGRVRELWRYPVKSTRGEQLAAVAVEPRGFVGDRMFAVYDADGRIGSGKITRRFRPIPALRDHVSCTTGDGVVIAAIDGTAIAGDDTALSAALGQPASLRAETDVAHHDAAPVHLISSTSLAWIANRVGRPLDAFEFRPNILFDTGESWPAEQGWIGRTVAIGDTVRLRIIEPTERCVMVNVCKDGTRDDRVLTILARENALCLGVYAQVLATGTVREGDGIHLQPG